MWLKGSIETSWKYGLLVGFLLNPNHHMTNLDLNYSNLNMSYHQESTIEELKFYNNSPRILAHSIRQFLLRASLSQG